MTDKLSESLRAELDSGKLESLPGPPPKRQTRWTHTELMAAKFAEPNWVVKGKIPVGLNILGGRPKVGKSWFSWQLSASVGTGGKFLGFDVERGPVLYIGLEDNAKRLQERSIKMQIPAEADIVLINEWKPLHKGGLDDLLIELESGDYRLAVIDTLIRATPGIDHSDPAIAPVMASLQSMAIHRNMCILAVDHTRKPSGYFFDPIDEIMGNTSKTAAADAIFALHTQQGKRGAVLKGRGRDIEDIDLRLVFDREIYTWQSLGDSSDIELTERKAELLAMLDETGKAQCSTIARAAGQDASNTRRRLVELVNEGLVDIETIEGKHFYEKK